MKTAEIRSKFLRYFEAHQHTIVPSASLVPQNDPTLLFTNAGMVPFKDVFTGREKRPYVRATSSQKCVRAGGKHNDLENVGFTARHHTFFEMLGNFSFGDYFKKDAIHFAWEFVTKILGLPKEKLYVTVYTTDDEAADIWHKQEGVPRDRISRFEADNFWAMGDTGPCGPCSEIFIDRGEKYGCGKETCAVGCDCDRFMEFWNLVFMQFERDASGNMKPLPKPSVDTGAGLERIASILQKVDTNYDIDSFQEIMKSIGALAKKEYRPNSPDAPSFRVIADHSRATAFLIGDGVLPSNEGRGYVLRRIMRRAIRHGKKLGFTGPFLHKTASFVIDQMADAYPDLNDKRDFIMRAVLAEEEQFFRTLERGLELLDEERKKLGKSKTLPGDIAFKLYDTYGFPLDLTRVILNEAGLQVDEKGFEVAMNQQREESRKHWKGSGDQSVDSVYLSLKEKLATQKKLPEFTGYLSMAEESECVAVLTKNAEGSLSEVSEASGNAYLVFLKTPFYGESGGQVGDRGRVHNSEVEADVIDVQRPVDDLIVVHVQIKNGKIKKGGRYSQTTEKETRALTARNHTATHLLHWALREVLGKHVKQAGSLVSPDLLRFDFTHFQAMTNAELERVESMINQKIWSSDPVIHKSMKKDEAVSAGAIAFFGEKYGETVRVIQVGDYSVELCGGTHVHNSGEIHLFKLGNESGIAAGVRRIVAYTSAGAFQYLRAQDEGMKAIRDRLKASSAQEVLPKIEKLFETEKALRKEIEKLASQNASGEVDALIQKIKRGSKGEYLVAELDSNPAGIKHLRDFSDHIKNKLPKAVAILGMSQASEGKALLLASVGPQAPKEIQANSLIQELMPLIDGRGGGKKDLAQAGGGNLAGLRAALQKAEDLLGKQLGDQ